jgi:uncharacterized protein (DUF305 family)
MKILALFLSLALLAVCERPPSPSVDHSQHDHSKMNHGAMDHSKMESSPGATEAPQELQFIDTMTAHHQGAIDMAQLVNTRTQRPEMKKLAQAIIDEQRREIAEMKEWRAKWFGDANPAINMDFPGMQTGMGGMDMTKLGGLKANEFDVEFFKQMIPHHEGAVEMAKALRGGDSYAELKELSANIVKSQTAEIEQMKNWLKEWGGQ